MEYKLVRMCKLIGYISLEQTKLASQAGLGVFSFRILALYML